MPQYLSPGVYVEEVPPAASPIAGVGTSTAGFIGVIPNTLYKREDIKNETVGKGDNETTEFQLKRYPVVTDAGKFIVKVDGQNRNATLINNSADKKSIVQFKNFPQAGQIITVDYIWTNTFEEKGEDKFNTQGQSSETFNTGENSQKEFDLNHYPVDDTAETFNVTIEGVDASNVQATLENTDQQKSKLTITQPATLEKNKSVMVTYKWSEPIKEFELSQYPALTKEGTFIVKVDGKKVKATLNNNDQTKKTTMTIQESVEINKPVKVNYTYLKDSVTPVTAGDRKKCTSFNQFVQYFGDLSFTDKDDGSVELPQNRYLHHAVYGFFNNGGTVCHVIRYSDENSLKAEIDKALKELATIDEIAIVAVPGITDSGVQEKVLTHCEILKDRFAILDGNGGENINEYAKETIQGVQRNSEYAALYFPWIKVTDPKIVIATDPEKNNTLYVPPSGHIAGVYGRVDGERGVYKAPANEAIRGALDVQYRLSKNDQESLNPIGINVIRVFNGTVKIWGARTIGGDDNGEFKYISTRRLYNFLRESIDEGTQFVVFEPNSLSLWQRIKRNVGDFLLGQWRDGALFGETPEKAFFVKCDEDTNPTDVQQRGEVITEIGVAIVKPAEFVIFRIQQITGS